MCHLGCMFCQDSNVTQPIYYSLFIIPVACVSVKIYEYWVAIS